MKNGSTGVIFTILLVCSSFAAVAQESLPPVPLGGSRPVTTRYEGQIVDVSSTGILATVYFDEISRYRVTGVVVRTSEGTTAGDVTIFWLNRLRAVELHLDPANAVVPFAMMAPLPLRPAIPHHRD